MATPLLTADTSVVVPSILGWHTQHQTCRDAVNGVRALPAQALVESFRVLTAVPAPEGRTISPAAAVRALEGDFPDPPFILAARGYGDALRRLVENGLRSGAIFDAVIGMTTVAAGARLLTRDQRAITTYRAVGAEFELVT